MKKRRYLRRTVLLLLALITGGYLLPETFVLPVDRMDEYSFNHQSFWYYPWGASVRHKGVDIFAEKGTKVYSATSGLVLYTGVHERGGNMVLVLGPKWRVHHYLHLDRIHTKTGHYLSAGDILGTTGNTGNAQDRPCHLHYAITTPIPYLWQADNGIQGWKKIWYVDPTPYLLQQCRESIPETPGIKVKKQGPNAAKPGSAVRSIYTSGKYNGFLPPRSAGRLCLPGSLSG